MVVIKSESSKALWPGLKEAWDKEHTDKDHPEPEKYTYSETEMKWMTSTADLQEVRISEQYDNQDEAEMAADLLASIIDSLSKRFIVLVRVGCGINVFHPVGDSDEKHRVTAYFSIGETDTPGLTNDYEVFNARSKGFSPKSDEALSETLDDLLQHYDEERHD